jgi:hypothetical protein
MPVYYNTNWMGVANMRWYQERGLTKKELVTLDEEDIRVKTLKTHKVGDVVEVEDITERYACGRIDICDGTPYGDEVGLPPMKEEDWARFSDWLDDFSSEEKLTRAEIVAEYEKTNPKIRWWEESSQEMNP